MLADSNHQRSLRETPSFFVMAFNVVRGCRIAGHATSLPEHPDDMLPLHLRQRSAADGLLCIGPYFGQRSTKLGTSGKDHRPSNEVFEFSYIARPRPTH